MSAHKFKPEEVLVDRGFDAEFSWERINEMSLLFSSDTDLQEFIYAAHAKDHSFDLKRGEFYPEILRAVISLKRTLSRLFDIELIQVQPNFGSNGSIDTLLTAVKMEAVRKKQDRGQFDLNDNLRTIIASSESTESKTAQIQHELSRLSSEVCGTVLFTRPTYFRNSNSASAKGLSIYAVPLNSDFQFPTASFIEKMLEIKPDIVFLVTPNNPTGLPISDADIISVLENAPPDTWVIVDRTLVNIDPEIATSELLNRYKTKNVVVLHSFSKYKGMSHHRIGVALYSNPDLAKVVQPHLPLGLGLEGCIKANRIVIEEQGIFPSDEIIHNIASNRQLLDEFTAAHPQFACTKFTGNYCLLTLPNMVTSEQVTEILGRQGLFVMGGHTFPEKDNQVIRLHVGGPPKYIELLCATLSKYPIDSI